MPQVKAGPKLELEFLVGSASFLKWKKWLTGAELDEISDSIEYTIYDVREKKNAETAV